MTGKKPNAYEMGELEQIYLKHLKNVMGRDEYITQVVNYPPLKWQACR